MSSFFTVKQTVRGGVEDFSIKQAVTDVFFTVKQVVTCVFFHSETNNGRCCFVVVVFTVKQAVEGIVFTVKHVATCVFFTVYMQ